MPEELRSAGFRDVPVHLAPGSMMAYGSGRRWHTLQRPTRDLPFSFEPEERSGTFHGSKQNLHNGYSRHSSLSLIALECRAQMVRTGQSCRPEPRSMTWGKYKGQGLPHNSTSESESLRESSFVASLRQTQTPLPSRKCALELPTQFKGQRNCRLPVCMVEQQCASVSESQASGWTEAQQNTSDQSHRGKNSWNTNPKTCSGDTSDHSFLTSMGHVAKDADGPTSKREAIFSTEVPQNSTNNSHKSSKGNLRNEEKGLNSGGQEPRGETYVFSSKKAQRVLRDQICRVVVNLEEVLRGLKEVQLEMKEVVHQIDQLTSDIDLGEEEVSEGCGTSRAGSPSEEMSKRPDTGIDLGRDTSEPNPNSPTPSLPTVSKDNKMVKTPIKEGKKTPAVPPPAYPTGLSAKNKSVLKSSSTPECTIGPRSQKPPPYPYGNRSGRANKAKDPSLKTPPYSGKRRLLSTTV